MHFASYIGHITTMELLLHHGADINAKGRNQYAPLHAVAASGKITVYLTIFCTGKYIANKLAEYLVFFFVNDF